MALVRQSLRSTAVEFWRLLSGTAVTLAAIWPQALGLLLLGWSANNLAVLLGTEVSSWQPWAVIPIVALGAVLQLVTILALLRAAARRLGVGAAGGEAGTVDPTAGSFSRLVAMTLLTFLVLYAAFGYLADYARRVVLLATYRKGFGDLLGALNPLSSPTTAVAMVSVVALGWLAGRLIEPWSERTRHPLPVKFLGIAVEAVVGLTILLGVFRIFEWLQLWASSRVFALWWDGARGWLRSLLHVDVPDIVQQLWSGFAEVIWPVLSTGVLRPLVWLAMAGLVFGTRVLSLAELWRLDAADGASGRGGMLARLRRDDEATTGIRAIVLRTQAFLFGGLDERVLPAWQSFRLVLRSGWPFLGAYLVAFTLVDLAGHWLEHLVIWLIGGHDVSFWIRVDPFVDLVTTVLVSTFQWVLLAVAYQRALGLDAPAGFAPPPPGRRARWTQALTVGAVSVAVVIAAGLAQPGEVEIVQHAATNERADLQGQRVVVGDPRLAHSVTSYGQQITTDRIFVVVPFGLASPVNTRALGVDVTLRTNGRSYAPFNGGSLVTAAPAGFSLVQDLVFEVDPMDVTASAVLRVRPAEVVSGTQQQAEIALGLGPDLVAAAVPALDIVTSPRKAAL
jgi:hypothetical protein